ncbi:MAG TPA: hypothetical protein VFB67_03360 [Candidatus Polarisedimenticolaceae bacterium]|nr:hypothetical protein [Candidatus Polarisedimenticolaceae bacterium]
MNSRPMRHVWSLRFVVLALASMLMPTTARALCATPLNFGQLQPACSGTYCVLVSPGAATPESTIGSFWALGFGNPALYAGVDNGSFADEDGWIGRFPGYTYLSGDWAVTYEIDGCIHGKVAPGKSAEIMVTEFSDRSNDGDHAYFAAAAVVRHPAAIEQFDFATGLGRNIVLAEIPKPGIASSQLVGPHQIEIVVPGPTASQIALGFFSDGSATVNDVIAGYRVYGHSWASGSPLPDRRRDAGWIPLSGTVPIGVAATVIVECTQHYAFLALSIVYDSGFESAYVSQPSTVIACEMCNGDADGDGWVVSPSCGAVDCDDAYSLTYPGARETNDDNDNQCFGDPGFGIVDELDGMIGFANPSDERILSWPAQAGASTYEVARSTDPAFSASCTAFPSATTSIADPDIPAPGAVFHYVVRPKTPHAGSWGKNSAGAERSTSCP